MIGVGRSLLAVSVLLFLAAIWIAAWWLQFVLSGLLSLLVAAALLNKR